MQQAAFLRIRRPVIDLFSVPTADNQATGFQRSEMVGYSGAGHFQHGGNIDHAFFTVAQKPEDAYSGGVAELFEYLRHGLKVCYTTQLLLKQYGLRLLSVVMGQ